MGCWFLVSHRGSKIDLEICLHDRNTDAWGFDLHDQDSIDLVVISNLKVVALSQSRKVAQSILQPDEGSNKKKAERIQKVLLVRCSHNTESQTKSLRIVDQGPTQTIVLHCLGIADVQKVDTLRLDLDKLS